MKYLALSAALLVSMLAAQTVRAADDDPNNKLGGYIGIGASRGVALFSGSIKDAFGSTDAIAQDSWGANARAGYRFHKFLAAEVEYEWMRDFPMSVENAPGMPPGGTVKIGKLQEQTVTANLKVIAPYGKFQPYFLAGAGATFVTVDKSFVAPVNQFDITNGAFAARFGLGLDYNITPALYLNIGGEVVTSSAKVSGPTGGAGRGLDYFSGQFGVGYRF